jgi:hypothetical protein
MMQALLRHDHVDSAAAYIHLAPAHLRRGSMPRARSVPASRAELFDAFRACLKATA